MDEQGFFMKMKSVFGIRNIVICVFILSALSAAARGTPEDAWQDVDGIENWQHEIDITEHDPGTYNVVIRGRDYAGNEYTEGPYNIRIDPESDKPVARIIYPEAGEVVRGTVDIVGVAVDDDAVEYVEVRINEESWQRAEGTEYWRHQIPSRRIEDGPHTIEVRAVDINGLAGDIYTNRFVLDTEPPVVQVTSHDSGSIVNGRVRFEGQVADANGIDRLELSRDDRHTFEQVRVSSERGEDFDTFRFDVRTDRQEDGPVIYWLRATDATGAQRLEPFLFFIDNESPDITIYEPESEADVYGVVQITGAIRDEIGVERFWYEWDGQEVDIPLVPGNPYWNVEINTGEHRGRWVDVHFYAVDNSGNQTHVRHRMANNQDAGRPELYIQSPEFSGENAVETVPSDAVIYGYVDGAHRASHVVVRGLADEPVEFPAYPAFAIPLHDGPVGRLDLRIAAVDELGYQSEEVRLRFTRSAAVPEVTINRIVYGDGSETPYVPGEQYDTLRSAELHGVIRSDASLDSVTARVGSGASAVEARVRTARGQEAGTTDYHFTLPRELGYGPVPIEVTAVDDFGAQTVERGLVYFRDLRRLEREPGFWIDDERVSAAGAVNLVGRNPLRARIIGLHGGGESFSNVRLEPEPDFLDLQVQGDLVTISAAGSGSSDEVYLRAETADGVELEAGPYSFSAVAGGSAMEIALDQAGESRAAQGFRIPLGARTAVTGQVRNTPELSELRWRINQGEWNNLRSRAADNQPDTKVFEITLPNDLAYGEHVLEVEAVGEGGGQARRRVGFSARAPGQAPARSNQLQFVDSRVTDDGFMVTTDDVIGGLFLGRPIAEAELIGGENLFELSVQGHQVQLRPIGQGSAKVVAVRIVTVDGQVVETPPRSAAVDYLDPELRIDAPAIGHTTNDAVRLQGSLTDEVGLDGLYYRIGHSGSFQQLAIGQGSGASEASESAEPLAPGAFFHTISLKGQQPGPLHIFIQGRDLTGRVVEHWLPVLYDTENPLIRFITPPGSEVINGLTSVIARIESASTITQLEYSLDGEQYSDLPLAETIDYEVDFSELLMAEQQVHFRATDQAGNVTVAVPDVQVSLEDDLPVVEIQIPEEDAVITSDFTISGMAFDDDEVSEIYWRIGEETEFQRIAGGSSFLIDVPLSDLDDNEHTIEVYAVDYYGLQGETVQRSIRVSLDEPEINMTSPGVEQTNRGTVRLIGTAEDANGIREVWLSFDNGSSFHRARGREEWQYDLNTELFEDGTYSVQVMAVDNYGMSSNYFTLVNIDNTPPFINIATPDDNDRVSQEFNISGRVEDNIGVEQFYLEIEPINREGETRTIELATATVLQHTVDIRELAEGWYNLRLTAIDAAENQTVVARNVFVQDEIESAHVSLLFPQDGAEKVGEVVVEGRAGAPVPVRRVQLYLNETFIDAAEINSRGFFRYVLTDADLASGENELQAYIEPSSGDRIGSERIRFNYEPVGPYVAVTSPLTGDFVSDRPWIAGQAGYVHDLDEDDRDNREALRSMMVDYVEVSLDNGRIFHRARGAEEWRFRIETADVPNGPLAVLVRAVFENGETAVTRTMYTVDKNPPDITLLSPAEDARLNTRVRLVGVAEDEHGIESIQAALRSGDKSGYAVPGFAQGMYVDANFLGLTYFKVGLGLSFFEDNVRLQGHAGLSPREWADGESLRFAGINLGGKLMANVLTLPFNLFFGPDWEFLSVNAALGATFDYILLYEPIGFSESNATNAVVLGAILGQIELPRIEIRDWDSFNVYALYFEPQLWFIPSDASPAIKPRMAVGVRMQLF